MSQQQQPQPLATVARYGPLPLLTQQEVDELRCAYAAGATLKRLHKIYGVSIKTIYQYVNNPMKPGR